jgi:GWxTD domain-containing protein
MKSLYSSSINTLITVLTIIFLVIPNKSYSTYFQPDSNYDWIDTFMIVGFILSVSKYSYDFFTRGADLRTLSEQDSSSCAYKYILDGEPREKFESLVTEKERLKFIDSFWENLDPDTREANNALKEEFTKRVKYANDQFSTPTRRGWQTDQGRIIIKYGMPSELISNSFENIEDILSGVPAQNSFSKYGEYELWIYDRPMGRGDISFYISGGRMFFLFTRFTSAAPAQQIYSSEIEETY